MPQNQRLEGGENGNESHNLIWYIWDGCLVIEMSLSELILLCMCTVPQSLNAEMFSKIVYGSHFVHQSKVPCVAAKWWLTNVALNTNSLLILSDCAHGLEEQWRGASKEEGISARPIITTHLSFSLRLTLGGTYILKEVHNLGIRMNQSHFVADAVWSIFKRSILNNFMEGVRGFLATWN